MQEIQGKTRTVRELLSGAKYGIDYYQREYKWQSKQMAELVNDLTGRFLEDYQAEDERRQVAKYGHYFLGSIIISQQDNQRMVVDGQQRLTSLTLLLIYLHNLQTGRDDAEPVEELIFSKKFGERSFNLNVPDRNNCMETLFEGKTFDTTGKVESVVNLVGRYQDIDEYFPDELMRATALPYFVDWLLEKVHLVEITAYADGDAYTIFETMNDRGLSLSATDMLKGYLLANIDDADKRGEADRGIKQWLLQFGGQGKETEADFFKTWLRSQLLLAPLQPGDDKATIQAKLKLVADYIDCWLNLRLWNFKSVAYSTVQYAVFQLTKELRGLSVEDLRTSLVTRLQTEAVELTFNTQPYLNNWNAKSLHRQLARMIDWVETQSGEPGQYSKYVVRSGQYAYEIEHIWANRYERHTDEFDSSAGFSEYRNRIGGLLLLPKKVNASLGDKDYDYKVEQYLKENLLAKSLHPTCYQNNPGFKQMIQRTGIEFQPHSTFKKADLEQRFRLYQSIADRLWSVERLRGED